MTSSPLAPHTASPRDLLAQQEAQRAGVPMLVYRTASGDQRIVLLREGLTIGRRPTCDIALEADRAVSRVHARIEPLDEEWTVVDDGLSTNGTFVNGARLSARRRLVDGDLLEIGSTTFAFCDAATGGVESEATVRTVVSVLVAPDLTATQQRVLAALCRPLVTEGMFAVPASNRQIADELVVTPDAVKRTMKLLFAAFGIDDLPQNQKRAALARAALRSGAVPLA